MTATRVSTATVPAAKRRDSKLWSETFDVRLGATQPLSPKEIKRQEVRGRLYSIVHRLGGCSWFPFIYLFILQPNNQLEFKKNLHDRHLFQKKTLFNIYIYIYKHIIYIYNINYFNIYVYIHILFQYNLNNKIHYLIYSFIN